MLNISNGQPGIKGASYINIAQEALFFGKEGEALEEKILYVKMFGTFSITCGNREIICNNRSSLLWNLLAYLLCHHKETVSTEALLPILWKQEKNDKPAGAMRTAIYRVRSILKELTEDESF